MARNQLKTFAFVGIGNLGSQIVKPFLSDSSVTVRILGRDTSKPELQAYAEKGAQLVTVDFDSADSLARALQGVDAVVSLLQPSPDAAASQDKLFRASKTAGVQLVVPSEWGADYENPKAQPLHPGLNAKVAYHKTLDQDIQIPWLAFAHGLFAEWALTPVVGFDWATRTAKIAGDGNSRFSSTSLSDIADFVHLALTTTQVPEAGAGRVIAFEGFTTTFNELLDLVEKTDGKKWTREYLDLAPLHAKQLEPSPEGFVAWLKASFGDGRGEIRRDVVENSKWGWKPKVTPALAAENAVAQQS